MAAMVHRRMEEEVVEQQHPRRRRALNLADDDEYGSESSDDDVGVLLSDEKSIYFDNKQDTKLQWSENSVMSAEDEAKISKLLVDAANKQRNIEGQILPDSTANNIIIDVDDDNMIVDVDGDDEMELEFERAVEKVHTHTPYCPKCNTVITKVTLRRKKMPETKPPFDIWGCFRCLAVFIPPGNCLNFGRPPFSRPEPIPTPKPPQSDNSGYESTTDDATGQQITEHHPPLSHDPEAGPMDPIDGGRPAEGVSPGNNNVGDLVTIQRSRSLEFLKCVAYGGLTESIVSFSIVSSAAASDATTLNVVVIGLASLFSGLVIFGSNLGELRNENSNEKYERVLGKKGHFAFHSTLAVLSYLVFGLIAPITYGFAFRESGDKDYKILAVAAAAFGSVFLLSIAKAYASRGRDEYVKTMLCYIMLAVSASGVAYAAGDLVGDVLNTIGMFRDHVPAPGSGWASY